MVDTHCTNGAIRIVIERLTNQEWNRRAAPVLYAEVVTSDVDKLYSLADSPAANARVASKAQNLGLIKALFIEYPGIVPADTPNGGCSLCHEYDHLSDSTADRNSSLYREKADIEDLVTMKRWLEKLGGADLLSVPSRVHSQGCCLLDSRRASLLDDQRVQ